MEAQDIKKMSVEELTVFVEEQKELKKQGKEFMTQASIAEALGISDSALRRKVNSYKHKGESTKNMSEQTSAQEIPKSTQMFTESEIKALKSIIKERERDIQVFHEYRIYSDLERVPVDAESVRSAFNMSKATTERLRKYASVRRLPLQDIVELAVIKLLDEYDK